MNGEWLTGTCHVLVPNVLAYVNLGKTAFRRVETYIKANASIVHSVLSLSSGNAQEDVVSTKYI